MLDINSALAQYLNNLSVPKEKREVLLQAQKTVRKILHKKFLGAQFLTQGSQQYKTANLPCYPPKQQLDVDDGMYLSVSLLNKYYLTKKNILPRVANCLELHAFENKWESVTAGKLCVRIQLSDDMHMDISCYRVENAEFEGFFTADHVLADVNGIFYPKHRKNSLGKIQFACAGKWKNSDRRGIIDWVSRCRNIYGTRYIRLCRIMKGWRDHQWLEKSPLSSIMLMVMVAKGLEKSSITCDAPETDDIVLLQVVSQLKNILQSGVAEPDGSTRISISDQLNAHEKDTCMSKFEDLKQALAKAMAHGTSPENSLRMLHKQFGDFFPKDTDMIKPTIPSETMFGNQPPKPFPITSLKTY